MGVTQQHCPKCGAPLAAKAPPGLCTRCALVGLLAPVPAAEADPSPNAGKKFPRRFGEYELVEEIARGGMGIVYKARQPGLNRTVALKVILSGVMASEDFVERFRTEAEAAASLDHPNIVPIYEIGEQTGEHYFTLKLVEGETLAQRIARDWSPAHPTPHEEDYLRSAGELIATLARAVHYAHQRGILHRDIKPNNVLLAKDGSPYLTDFGLAKLVEKESTITKTTAVLGTPSYMSPEQARGETKRLTTAADVYGLGAILYELLTGRPPFAGGTTLATIQQVLEQEPMPPSASNPKVDRDLETICLKCLRKELEQRYTSAEALAEDLEHWLRHEPIDARPVGARERLAKWIRRNPRGATLLMVTAVAVLASIVAPTWLSVRLQEANSRAAIKAEENRQSLVRLNVARGVDLLDQADLAGALPWFVEALKLDQGKPQREKVHRTRIAAVLNQLPRLVGLLVPPTNMTTGGFSPDGRKVLMYAEEAGFAQVWDLTTGQLTPPRMQHRAYVTFAQFNHRGDRIITASHDGTAQIWDAQSGQPVTPPLRHGAAISAAAISPDDRRLVTGGLANGVKVWDTATGELIATHEVSERVSAVACSPDGKWIGATLGQQVRLWDTQTGALQRTFRTDFAANLRKMAFSEDSSKILAAAGSGLRVWDLLTGTVLGYHLNHPGFWTYGGQFSPNSATAMSFGRDAMVRFWSVGPDPVKTIPLRHNNGVRYAEYSPDGLHIATACDDQFARVWNAVTGELQFSLRHGRRLLRSRMSADGRLLLTVDSGMSRVWDLANAALEGPALRLTEPVGLGFSKSGRQLVTVASDRSLRLWEIATGRELPLSALEPGSPAPTLAEGGAPARVPHPDGKRELVFPEGATVVRDLATGKRLTPPMRHREAVVAAAFSPDGRYVATASVDRTARVWDAITGNPITPILHSASAVYLVVFGPDSRHVGIVSGGGEVEVWRLDTDPRPLADLEALSQLLSARRITQSGDLEDLDQGALLDLWDGLKRKYPQDFQTTPEQQTLWHWQEAVMAPAEAEYAQSTRVLDPQFDVRRWAWKGRFEAFKKQWAAARQSFSRALEFDVKDPWLWRERSQVQFQLGQSDPALKDLDRALELTPDDATLWAARARCELAADRMDPALSDLSRAIELSPDSSEFYELRGRVAVKGRKWHRAIADFARARALVNRLAYASGAASPSSIPARTAGVSPNCLDLGTFFNAPLTGDWRIPSDVRVPNGLSELPRGLVTLDGVPFEIRGVAQLAGRDSRLQRASFPESLLGIALPRYCRRIHVLHATEAADDSPGSMVGKLVIHFANGATEELPLRYGEQLAAVFSSSRERPKSANSAIAWENNVRGFFRHQTLYRTTWENPHPAEELAMLDYQSTLPPSGPFLVAVTVEPRDSP